MRWSLSICCSAFAAMTFATNPAASQTIKIGVILTYSGPNANNGIQIDRALRLYMKEHAKDLPPGVNVELVVRDDGGPNPDVARRLAQELIVRDKVNILTGLVWTPNAVAIAPVVTQAKIPLIVMNAAASGLPRLSPYMVRTSYTLWQFAYPMGEWAAQQKIKTAYVAVPDFVPGHEIEAAFTKGFTMAGGQMLGSVRIALNSADYVPFMRRAMDARPEVVYVMTVGGRASSQIVKQAHDLGFSSANIKLMGSCELVAEEDLPQHGDAALGIESACNYTGSSSNPRTRAFVEAWKREYGENAEPTFLSVGGWDGMDAIYQVIKKLNGAFDADQAMEVLKNWSNPDSPRGPVKIDPATRDIVQNIYIRRVEKRNGRLENVNIDTIKDVSDPWARFQ